MSEHDVGWVDFNVFRVNGENKTNGQKRSVDARNAIAP